MKLLNRRKLKKRRQQEVIEYKNSVEIPRRPYIEKANYREIDDIFANKPEVHRLLAKSNLPTMELWERLFAIK